ncbi:MAG: FAD-dependent thymidylate synthase [bacterium]|nr:FAD-dependent thymidylate synthase [bacterium]
MFHRKAIQLTSLDCFAIARNDKMSEIKPIDSKESYNSKNDPDYIACLDKGFVRLVEVMGDDQAIVQAARVSYGKGTKNLRADKALIHYLMQHRHTTPFEMIEFKFHCRMPVFVARQWIRHRTANVNEVSGRYSIMEECFWEPSAEDLRQQSSTNRQGSTEKHLEGEAAEKIVKEFKEEQKKLYKQYESYLDAGVAREIARANLPLSLYTEWYWKIDLHNLLHFLHLRMDPHAQKEIRIFAEAMAVFVKKRCPIAWEAFEEHFLNAATLSQKERKIISEVIQKNNLWKEIESKRLEELKKEEATPARIERELADLKKRLFV